MADFTALKTAIQNAIKQNGNEEITGNLLQDVLLAIVTTLGEGNINNLISALNAESNARQLGDSTLQSNINTVTSAITSINYAIANGCVYAGIATPTGTPATGRVFYLALTAGTYTNYGNKVVTQGINILRYNGSAWSLDVIASIDDAPTPSSNNLVKSSGVFNDILTNGSAFDLSAYNNGTTYADLNAALTALNALPAAYKRGGMSLKFVLTSDNKYVQYRLMADEWSADTNDWAIADEGVYVENPEFVYVKTDKDNKILWAIKTDGDIYYGAGVPQQVIDYINEKIAELSLDEYEDIVAFLNDLEKGDKTLRDLLDEKVDKVEGKSLIDEEYASTKSTIESPEFLDVTIDAEDKIIEGVQLDGTKVIGGDMNVGGSTSISGDIKVLGNMEVSGVSYKVIENPEYLAVWVDNDGKVIFGLKADGKTFVGDADFLNDIKNNQEAINEIKSYFANIDWDALTSITAIENPELIEAKTDSEGKLLAGRTPDGAAFENVGFATPKVSIDGHTIENIEDSEGRSEITTDSEGKIISYREADGTKVENALEVSRLSLKDEAIETVKSIVKNTTSIVHRSIPKYGTSNIKTETFYVTKNENVHNINNVVVIQDFPDTDANAVDRMTIAHYYVLDNTITDNGDGSYTPSNSSIRLRHYASGRVKLNSSDNKYYAKETIRKIGNVWYYADTLGYTVWNGSRNKVISGYSEEYTGEYPETGEYASVNTEVVKLSGPVNVNTWTVEDWDFNAVEGTDIGKKYEHNCVCDVDFGDYYHKSNVAIGVKHQGNSTQGNRKRNYRYTFYKNNTYSKKDKLKIGEMLRLSGYNLKANWRDKSRIKECILYRLFTDIWNNRPITDRYDWDNTVNGYYHGATGNIEGFPIRLSVNGSFYGLYIFGLKKDEKNYMLDGEDESGLFISGNERTGWGASVNYYSPAMVKNGFDEEMLDDMSESTANAVSTWFEFINNRLYIGSDNNEYHKSLLTDVDGTMYVTSSLDDGSVVPSSISCGLIEFDKTNAATRLDVLGFIDYFICLQVFILLDNTKNNIMFYSNEHKKKIWPFFYDLDGAIEYHDFMIDLFADDTPTTVTDKSFWKNLKDLYWDEIRNRYYALRRTSLNVDYIEGIYEEIIQSIPHEDFNNEQEKWSVDADGTDFKYDKLPLLERRFNYLDTHYFV